MGAFVRRIRRACSRRVADGDVEALILMTGLAEEIDMAIAGAVKGPARLRLLLGRDRPAPRHLPPGRSAAIGQRLDRSVPHVWTEPQPCLVAGRTAAGWFR